MNNKIFVTKDNFSYTLFKQNSNDEKAHNFMIFEKNEIPVIVSSFVKYMSQEQLEELKGNIVLSLSDMMYEDMKGDK